jgi:signal transduction histidine kinase
VETDLVCRGKQQALLGAIHNLIQNAAQAGSHSVECQVSVENDSVTVRVRDDGRGCDVEQMETLFAPYQSACSGGTGLGLTIARQIARAHGGDLRCVASSPAGSEFLMQWPILGVSLSAKFEQSISPNRIRSEV